MILMWYCRSRCIVDEKYLKKIFFPQYYFECIDRCGSFTSVFKRKSVDLLKKAWSARVQVFDIQATVSDSSQVCVLQIFYKGGGLNISNFSSVLIFHYGVCIKESMTSLKF